MSGLLHGQIVAAFSRQYSARLVDGFGGLAIPGIFGSNGLGYVRASLCQPEALLREALARVNEYQKRTVMLI